MKEIEKKYLVEYVPDIEGYETSIISQGYLSYEPEVRIRLMDDQCFLTKKGDGDLVREEIETEIEMAAFKILYSLIQGRIISKKRVFIPLDSGYKAELDIYEDDLSGLLTVEVEFPSEEEAESFVPPIWFSQDITKDKRFKNKALARDNLNVLDLLNSSFQGRKKILEKETN